MRRRVRDIVARARSVVRLPLLRLGLRLLRRRATPSTMRLLHFAWANSWAAKPDYLMAIAARVEANPPRHVLECGSGLTTLVLGALARNGGFTVLALEQDEQWASTTQRTLQQFDLAEVSVVYAPLVGFEAFSWYSLPGEMLDRFDLVVCDGPPSGTFGGRFGLLPVLHDRLAGATVLVDDADSPVAREMLDRWRDEFGADVTIEGGLDRGLAVVEVPGVNQS